MVRHWAMEWIGQCEKCLRYWHNLFRAIFHRELAISTRDKMSRLDHFLPLISVSISANKHLHQRFQSMPHKYQPQKKTTRHYAKHAEYFSVVNICAALTESADAN